MSETESMTLVLIPENNSFQGKRTLILSQPVTLGRQLDNQESQSATMIRFPSKVVSRMHCKLSYDIDRFYVQDTKSSSGTFLNGQRLSPQGMESLPTELHDGDIIKLGEDFNQGGTFHQSIVMKVKLPGQEDEEDQDEPAEEEAYVDVTMDNDVRATVDDEFNTIWNSLVADINSPLKKLRNSVQITTTAATVTSMDQVANDQLRRVSTVSPTSQSIRNDNTVTLIKSQLGNTQSSIASDSNVVDRQQSDPANKLSSDAQAAVDCAAFIESLKWESTELKDALVDLAKKQDSQLIAFYRSLKGFPSSFINVASKYVKYSKKK
ncbi:hypothetical protein MP228_010950 [Amoeboaphelidium protococcarum]|nr:hypothetical protein MP228_010950 [Amoeboaphelidium protococcarum]